MSAASSPVQNAERVTGELIEVLLPLAQMADQQLNSYRWVLAKRPEENVFESFSEALEWMDSSVPTIRGCIRIAHGTGRHEEAWKLAEALWAWLHVRKDWPVWRTSHELALGSAKKCGDAPSARMLAALGSYHTWQENLAEAESHLQHARALWVRTGHDLGYASCLEALGMVLLKQERPKEARSLYTKARDKFSELARERGVVLMQRRIGECYREEGDLDAALSHIEPAFLWFREEGDTYQEIRTGRSLALVFRALNRTEDADSLLRRLSCSADSIGADTDAAELNSLLPVPAGA